MAEINTFKRRSADGKPPTANRFGTTETPMGKGDATEPP
jgi:hypothetical protein